MGGALILLALFALGGKRGRRSRRRSSVDQATGVSEAALDLALAKAIESGAPIPPGMIAKWKTLSAEQKLAVWAAPITGGQSLLVVPAAAHVARRLFR